MFIFLKRPNAGIQPRRTAPIEGARFAQLFASTADHSRFTFCFSKMDFGHCKASD
jgi:hypothetical protein